MMNLNKKVNDTPQCQNGEIIIEGETEESIQSNTNGDLYENYRNNNGTVEVQYQKQKIKNIPTLQRVNDASLEILRCSNYTKIIPQLHHSTTDLCWNKAHTTTTITFIWMVIWLVLASTTNALELLPSQHETTLVRGKSMQPEDRHVIDTYINSDTWANVVSQKGAAFTSEYEDIDNSIVCVATSQHMLGVSDNTLMALYATCDIVLQYYTTVENEKIFAYVRKPYGFHHIEADMSGAGQMAAIYKYRGVYYNAYAAVTLQPLTALPTTQTGECTVQDGCIHVRQYISDDIPSALYYPANEEQFTTHSQLRHADVARFMVATPFRYVDVWNERSMERQNVNTGRDTVAFDRVENLNVMCTTEFSQCYTNIIATMIELANADVFQLSIEDYMRSPLFGGNVSEDGTSLELNIHSVLDTRYVFQYGTDTHACHAWTNGEDAPSIGARQWLIGNQAELIPHTGLMTIGGRDHMPFTSNDAWTHRVAWGHKIAAITATAITQNYITMARTGETDGVTDSPVPELLLAILATALIYGKWTGKLIRKLVRAGRPQNFTARNDLDAYDVTITVDKDVRPKIRSLNISNNIDCMQPILHPELIEARNTWLTTNTLRAYENIMRFTPGSQMTRDPNAVAQVFRRIDTHTPNLDRLVYKAVNEYLVRGPAGIVGNDVSIEQCQKIPAMIGVIEFLKDYRTLDNTWLIHTSIHGPTIQEQVAVAKLILTIQDDTIPDSRHTALTRRVLVPAAQWTEVTMEMAKSVTTKEVLSALIRAASYVYSHERLTTLLTEAFSIAQAAQVNVKINGKNAYGIPRIHMAEQQFGLLTLGFDILLPKFLNYTETLTSIMARAENRVPNIIKVLINHNYTVYTMANQSRINAELISMIDSQGEAAFGFSRTRPTSFINVDTTLIRVSLTVKENTNRTEILSHDEITTLTGLNLKARPDALSNSCHCDLSQIVDHGHNNNCIYNTMNHSAYEAAIGLHPAITVKQRSGKKKMTFLSDYASDTLESNYNNSRLIMLRRLYKRNTEPGISREKKRVLDRCRRIQLYDIDQIHLDVFDDCGYPFTPGDVGPNGPGDMGTMVDIPATPGTHTSSNHDTDEEEDEQSEDGDDYTSPDRTTMSRDVNIAGKSSSTLDTESIISTKTSLSGTNTPALTVVSMKHTAPTVKNRDDDIPVIKGKRLEKESNTTTHTSVSDTPASANPNVEANTVSGLTTVLDERIKPLSATIIQNTVLLNEDNQATLTKIRKAIKPLDDARLKNFH